MLKGTRGYLHLVCSAVGCLPLWRSAFREGPAIQLSRRLDHILRRKSHALAALYSPDRNLYSHGFAPEFCVLVTCMRKLTAPINEAVDSLAEVHERVSGQLFVFSAFIEAIMHP